MTATVHTSSGTQYNETAKTTWSSYNTSVATITSGGMLTAVSSGATTIEGQIGWPESCCHWIVCEDDVKRAGYLLFMVGIVLGFGPYLRAQSGCEASAELSAPIAEFEARQVSPIEALLRFGAQYHVCFGFQYVDESFLTRPADFHLRDTTVRDAVLRILDSGPPLAVEQYYGVIEISRRIAGPQPTNIFDHVVPQWEANQGFVQLVSWLLHIQLVTDLNPEAKGFAIHAAAGDPHDGVGPFNEHNMSVKHLLDKIVAQSKGAAWIAQVQWGQQGNLSLPEERRECFVRSRQN